MKPFYISAFITKQYVRRDNVITSIANASDLLTEQDQLIDTEHFAEITQAPASSYIFSGMEVCLFQSEQD